MGWWETAVLEGVNLGKKGCIMIHGLKKSDWTWERVYSESLYLSRKIPYFLYFHMFPYCRTSNLKNIYLMRCLELFRVLTSAKQGARAWESRFSEACTICAVMEWESSVIHRVGLWTSSSGDIHFYWRKLRAHELSKFWCCFLKVKFLSESLWQLIFS